LPGASGESAITSTLRDLPLGYIQQLNYGPWFLLGMPLLLASAAMAWTWWNRSCENLDNNIPKDASLRNVSQSIVMAVAGITLVFFFAGTSIEAEVRDYRNLGLGWVQAKAIHDAAAAHTMIPGNEFRHFTDGEHLREVVDARVISLEELNTGMYRRWLFWTFVVVVKFLGGLWQATVVYLSLLYIRVGVRLMRHMKERGLNALDGSVQWTITPAIMMFTVGTLTNVFSSSRYIANLAKGSYGSWDQYASFIVISPGLATLVFGVVALYLVYFEARGTANPWAGTSKPYWWALGMMATAWMTSSMGVVHLLIGLDPAAAKQMTDLLQHSVGGK
jgi:hypothetical protein